jgi:hypothetical protein
MDLVLIHYHGEKFMSNILKKIKLADIYGNPNQPRRRFDAEGLAELAGSIESTLYCMGTPSCAAVCFGGS